MAEMSQKDAVVKITEWIGAQMRTGVLPETIAARVMSEPQRLAAEIGVPVNTLTADVFGTPNEGELLDAMVDAALDDVIKHEADSPLGKLLSRPK